MIKQLTLLLISLGTVYCGLAQEYQSILWEITHPELQDTSYLFGTMHARDQRVFNFRGEVSESFEKSGSFAMEVNPDSIDKAGFASLIVMDSLSLPELLSKEEYAEVNQYFKDTLNMPLAFYNRILPIFLSQMVGEIQLNSEQEVPLDLHLFKMAKDQNKKIIGLEKMTDQLKILKNIPYHDQAKMLYNSISTSKDHLPDTKDILELYVKEDLDSLLILTEVSPDSLWTPEMQFELLTRRNELMTQKILEISAEDSYFIAVGAAHLPGEKGIIALLRKEGYLVISK